MNKNILTFLGLVVLIVGIALQGNMTYASTPGDIIWSEKANLLEENYHLSAVSSNGKVYAIGGHTDNGIVGDVQEYDPTLDIWSYRTSMPTARQGMGLATLQDGTIYAIGGQASNGSIIGVVEKYDPSTDTWTTKTSMPTARTDFGTVVSSNGKIYAMGGVMEPSTIISTLESYDPLTDTWETLKSMSTQRYGLASGEGGNGKLYAIGGNPGSGPSKIVEEYNIDTDTWSSRADMLTRSVYLGVVSASNGKLYAIGGETPSISSTAQSYNPINDTWEIVTNMLTPRTAFGLAVTGDTVYAIGGIDNNGLPIDKVDLGEIVIPAPPEPVEIVLNSVADTYVQSGNPNKNEGSSQFIRIKPSGNNRALLKFDQSDLGSQITGDLVSAKLRLYITDNGNNWGSSGRTIGIHRLSSNWLEGNGYENGRGSGSGATWNCAIDENIYTSAKDCSGVTEWEMDQPNNPSAHPWVGIPTDSVTIVNNQTGLIEFDVTADLLNMLNDFNNYGWLIKRTNEDQSGRVDFGSRESLFIPQLIVKYQP